MPHLGPTAGLSGGSAQRTDGRGREGTAHTPTFQQFLFVVVLPRNTCVLIWAGAAAACGKMRGAVGIGCAHSDSTPLAHLCPAAGFNAAGACLGRCPMSLPASADARLVAGRSAAGATSFAGWYSQPSSDVGRLWTAALQFGRPRLFLREVPNSIDRTS